MNASSSRIGGRIPDDLLRREGRSSITHNEWIWWFAEFEIICSTTFTEWKITDKLVRRKLEVADRILVWWLNSSVGKYRGKGLWLDPLKVPFGLNYHRLPVCERNSNATANVLLQNRGLVRWKHRNILSWWRPCGTVVIFDTFKVRTHVVLSKNANANPFRPWNAN